MLLDFRQPAGELMVTHRIRVEPSRSMKSVSGDVQALLDEYGESSRRSCALLASELIAQIIGREPHWDGEPVELTIRLRDDAVRLEANGPRSRSNPRGAAREPLAEWGQFILDRLADRWGIGPEERHIWAEVDL